MKKQYDLLWKIILEPFFYDFLKFVDPILADTIDESKKPGFLDKELISQVPNAQGGLDHRIVDKLVKLYTKSGAEEWILCHLEVQHSYNKDFAERMYFYFHSIYQKFKKPITTYAIFTESSELERNNVFKIDFGATKLVYEFNTYKIALQDEQELIKDPNPFALIVLIARQIKFKTIDDDDLSDKKLLASKLEIAKLIFERKLPPEKENNLIHFLFYYIDFEIKENKTTFERTIKLLTDKNIDDMTMQEAILEETKFEGIREGKQISKEEVVTRMIIHHLSDDQIIEYVDVEPGFVNRLRQKVGKN